jgi:PAS domain-containing protein
VKFAPSPDDFLAQSDTFFLVVTDMRGNYQYANPHFLHRFGGTTEDYIGKPFLIALVEEDVEACIKAAHQCLANPLKPVRVVLRKPMKEGGILSTVWDFSVMKDPLTGEVMGVRCVGYDHSHAALLEKKVFEYANNLEVLFEGATEGMGFLNEEGQLLKYNSLLLEMLCLSKQSIETRPIWEVLPKTANPSLPKGLEDSVRYRKPFSQLIFVKETQTWLRFRMIFTGKDPMVLVTDRTRMIQYVGQLRRKNSSLEELAFSFAHEIRKPLASILGLISIMDRRELDQQLSGMLDMLDASASELDSVVHRVVDQISHSILNAEITSGETRSGSPEAFYQ